jgi:predicted DNA-binding transcriptional regulator AlpA
MLDTKAAAEHLGLAPVTLRQWRSQERGPTFIRMGKSIRYRLADLDEWIERHAEGARNTRAPRRQRKR